MQTEVGRALRTNDDDLDGRIEFFFRTFHDDPVEGLARSTRRTFRFDLESGKVSHSNFPPALVRLSYDSAPNSIFLRINARDVKKWPREAAK